MKQGIVISTHIKTKGFLQDCLVSLSHSKYPIVVNYNTDKNNTWELGAIKLGKELFDEFLYLHDTIIIKDIKLLDILFRDCKDFSVSIMPRFNSYFGKYRKEILDKIDIPQVSSKVEAVHAEIYFNENYINNEPSIIELCPEVNGWEESEVFEIKHGRNNMIFENQFFKKFKGTWRWDMI